MVAHTDWELNWEHFHEISKQVFKTCYLQHGIHSFDNFICMLCALAIGLSPICLLFYAPILISGPLSQATCYSPKQNPSGL